MWPICVIACLSSSETIEHFYRSNIGNMHPLFIHTINNIYLFAYLFAFLVVPCHLRLHHSTFNFHFIVVQHSLICYLSFPLLYFKRLQQFLFVQNISSIKVMLILTFRIFASVYNLKQDIA